MWLQHCLLEFIVCMMNSNYPFIITVILVNKLLFLTKISFLYHWIMQILKVKRTWNFPINTNSQLTFVLALSHFYSSIHFSIHPPTHLQVWYTSKLQTLVHFTQDTSVCLLITRFQYLFAVFFFVFWDKIYNVMHKYFELWLKYSPEQSILLSRYGTWPDLET